MCRKLNNNIKTYYISRIEMMLAWEIYVYLLGGLVVVWMTARDCNSRGFPLPPDQPPPWS